MENNKEKLIDYLPDDGNIRLKWWNKFLIKELGKKRKRKEKTNRRDWKT